MNWPGAVDIVTEDDVCKGAWYRNGRLCAPAWLITWFGTKRNYRKAWHTMAKVIGIARNEPLSAWYDASDRKLADIAAALNETNRRLGYDVPRRACGKYYDKEAEVMA